MSPGRARTRSGSPSPFRIKWLWTEGDSDHPELWGVIWDGKEGKKAPAPGALFDYDFHVITLVKDIASGDGLRHHAITPLYPHPAAPFNSLQFSVLLPLDSSLRVVGLHIEKPPIRLLVFPHLVAGGERVFG